MSVERDGAIRDAGDVLSGKSWWKSIRLKTLLIVLLMLTPLILMGIAGTLYYQGLVMQNINDGAITQAKTIAAFTTEYMNTSQQYLQSLADRPLVVKAVEENDRSFLHSMAVYANTTDRISEVFFTDRQGIIIESTPDLAGLIGSNSSGHAYVGSVIRTGNPMIGVMELGVDRMPDVPVGVPVKDGNGTVIGVMVGRVDLGVYDKMIVDTFVKPQQIFYMVNETGHVMIHTNPVYPMTMRNFTAVPGVQHVLRGETGVSEYYNPIENQSRLGAYAPVEPWGWGVIVALPVDVAYQPVWNATWLAAGIVALFSLMAGGLGLYLGNSIATPITNLSLATRKIDTDEYRGLLPLARDDEIGELARSFDHMVDTVKRDAIELKRADEVHSQLASIVESSKDAIIGKTPDGIITSWNEGAELVYGYRMDEVIGKPVSILAPPNHPDEIPGILEKIRQGEGVVYYDTQRVRKDGKLIDVSLTVSPIKDLDGHVIGAATIARDITERKMAEEALRESEERFRALADNMPNLAWMANADGWIFWYNKQWYDYTGTTLEEMQGWGWQKVHHPDYIKAVTEEWSSRIKAGEPYDNIFPLRGKDGNFRWFLTRVTPIRDEQGNIQRWFGTNTDITERKQAEDAKALLVEQLKVRTSELQDVNEKLDVNNEELAATSEELECSNEELRTNNEELQCVTGSLREAQVYLESLINNANAPIIVWDPQSVITRFNRAFERLSGYTAEEVLGKDLKILFPPASREESLEKIKKTLEGEQWESVEIPILHKFGSVRIVLWNSANIYSAENVLLATIAQGQDITRRKEAEKELEEAKTQAELYLDLMGHDISNMHQIIMMQLELAADIMKAEGKLEGEDKEIIGTSTRTLKKAAKLIDNVRKLQKLQSGEYSLEPVDLTKALKDVLNDYSNIPGRDITIKSALDGESLVRANPLLKDVFSNLVDNAVKHSSDPLEIGVNVHKVDMNGSSYYRVAIEDNGNGIPDDKKAEVFHRFLRGQTKARGTGLGLYLVKSLVEGFGGFVEIQNRVLMDYTKGTRFLVYLPVIEEEKDAAE